MASTRRSEPEGDGHVDHSPHYTQPRWLEGKATTADLAARTAQMWLTNPVNKMQLPEVMMFADKDGSGQIDKEEFKDLLKASGANVSTIANMMSLFNQADKDGSGTLTIDELKTLGDRNRNKFKAQN